MDILNLKNLQQLATGEQICINIDQCRYSDGFFMGIDFPLRTGALYGFRSTESIKDYIEAANSSGDLNALEASSKLCEFSNMHKEFLFTRAKTIEEGFGILEKRAELWLKLDHEDQMRLLDDFVLFEVDAI